MLSGKARDEDGDVLVDICYRKLLDQPILKTELRQHPRLQTLGVIAMPRGRNPFRILDKEWEALKALSPELRRADPAVAT